jgi:DNA-binding GntR family transcriptional regulator
MGERVMSLVSLVADLSLRSVTGRLVGLLLAGAESGVVERPRWFTQAELATRLGTVPDVIQRALRNLEEEALVRVTRRTITILDADRLKALRE